VVKEYDERREISPALQRDQHNVTDSQSRNYAG